MYFEMEDYMFFKIENSGCEEEKGFIKIRFDLFLDPMDYRYNETYYLWPTSEAYGDGYKGVLDGNELPIDQNDYDTWWDSLEKEWVHAPFQSHFVYFESTVTEEEIMFCGEWACIEIKRRWDNNIDPCSNDRFKNKPLIKIIPSVEDIEVSKTKIEEIKSKNLEKRGIVDIWAK